MITSVRQDVATLGQCRDNLSLLFNRMCQGIDEPVKKELEQKKKAIDALSHGYTATGYIDLYKYALNQWRRTMEGQEDAVCFTMRVTSPLIVGKGDQNVHEFGITLQLPWGTPVIPGSAIKGVLSSFAHEHGGEQWKKGTWADFSGALSLIMFGGSSEDKEGVAGGLDFADAWWIPGSDKKPFTKDIITAHNRSYYQEKGSWPHGMDDPVPVQFIVVKPGEEFFFVIKGAEKWRNLAQEMLIAAADQYGFGAKTRVGYGRMEYVRSDNDWLQALPDLNDSELAGLYRRRGLGNALQEAIIREAQGRGFSEELKKILQKVSPAVCFLHDLEEHPPTQWKDVKNVYTRYKNSFKNRGISRRDSIVQQIFAKVVHLAPVDLPPWFADFAPTASDVLHGKTADEIADFLPLVYSRKWPPFVDFENAIQTSELDEEEKELCLMVFEELVAKGA